MLTLLKLRLRALAGRSGVWGMALLMLGASPLALAGTVTNLFNFDLHYTAAGVVSDGTYVYGSTYDTTRTSGGTLFRVSVTGGAPQVIRQLSTSDGYSPRATLLLSTDGYLYGTTHNSPPTSSKTISGGGTVFRVRPDGSNFETLYDFAGATTNSVVDDSVFADYALVEDATSVYGVAKYGGTNGTGFVYAINKTTRAYAVLGNFAAGTQISTGVYGTASGSNRSMVPNSSLVVSGSKLYGVTQFGGVNAVTNTSGTVTVSGAGTVYVLDVSNPVITTIADFDALDTTNSPSTNTSGVYPASPLVEIGSGQFVGTTASGGSGYGTAYKIVPSGTTTVVLTTLYSFDSTNGANPSGKLVLATNGSNRIVYGISTTGAANSYGNLFALTFDANNLSAAPTFSVEHNFTFGEGLTMRDGVSRGFGTDTDLYLSATTGGACTEVSAGGYGSVLRYSFAGNGYSSYASCTTASTGGGGAWQMPWLWLLGALGLVPVVRRRMAS